MLSLDECLLCDCDSGCECDSAGSGAGLVLSVEGIFWRFVNRHRHGRLVQCRAGLTTGAMENLRFMAGN